MDLEGLALGIEAIAEDVEGEGGGWHFVVEGVRMACMTDTHYDRMRIVAPIVELRSINTEHLYAMLEANYHTALDVRYAISEAVVMAAFIHPLSPLDDAQLRSAIRQVASAVTSFGRNYSSGELVFGPSGADDADKHELN